MQTRKLGRTGLKVAALWLGGDVFGWTLTNGPPLPGSMPTWRAAGTSSIRPTSTRK